MLIQGSQSHQRELKICPTGDGILLCFPKGPPAQPSRVFFSWGCSSFYKLKQEFGAAPKLSFSSDLNEVAKHREENLLRHLKVVCAWPCREREVRRVVHGDEGALEAYIKV